MSGKQRVRGDVPGTVWNSTLNSRIYGTIDLEPIRQISAPTSRRPYGTVEELDFLWKLKS